MTEIRYQHLLGKKFEHGKQDCLSLVCGFYNDNFDLGIPDYVRPDDWWDQAGLSLYTENYPKHGFKPIDYHPSQWRVGDLFLMAIRSPHGVPNHAAIMVAPDKIIHHFVGRMSEEIDYSGLWRNTTTHVLRNSDLPIPHGVLQMVDANSILATLRAEAANRRHSTS